MPFVFVDSEELVDLINLVAGKPEFYDFLDRLNESVTDSEKDAYRQRAIDAYHVDGECEIDDDAVVSIGGDGAYVHAWVFVERIEEH